MHSSCRYSLTALNRQNLQHRQHSILNRGSGGREAGFPAALTEEEGADEGGCTGPRGAGAEEAEEGGQLAFQHRQATEEGEGQEARWRGKWGSETRQVEHARVQSGSWGCRPG